MYTCSSLAFPLLLSSFSHASPHVLMVHLCLSLPRLRYRTHAHARVPQAGIVEKLLPSYGFIQCCERQARLFFHYSQFNGNIEHLKLGDPVEFEMTYDRRTGKPIASAVQKISNEVFPTDDVMNPDQPGQTVNGFITTEPLPGRDGRVAYENRGECFFLPFTLDDVEPGLACRANDKVSFRIATDKTGSLRARKLTLLTNTPGTPCLGLACP